MRGSRFMSSSASKRVPGRLSMPLSARVLASMEKIFSVTSSGGTSPRSMPSSPAARQTASARYGLQDGSGQRSSTRVL